MTTREERMIKELQHKTHLSSFQLDLVSLYMGWAYAVGFDDGRKQTAHGKRVAQIRGGCIVQTFDTMSEAAHHIGVDKSSIGKAVRGIIPLLGGCKWKLVKTI